MRILTGALRGRKILFKANPRLRPTADKVRKAILDTLRGQVECSSVLDLFSGTGAMGFEALSIGARQVTFVEQDLSQAKKIRENAMGLGLAERSVVLNQDAFRAIRSFERSGERFELVFVDPPYEGGLSQKALEALSEGRVVHSGSFVILESKKGEGFPDEMGRLSLVKKKFYGETQVFFYKSNR